MIDKSIRADYDIKNRRRYFTGAFGGAGAGRGRDPSPSSGGGGGRDPMPVYSAPALAPSPHREEPIYVAPAAPVYTPPVTQRDVMPIIAPEPWTPVSPTKEYVAPIVHPEFDTPEQIEEQKEIIKEQVLKQKIADPTDELTTLGKEEVENFERAQDWDTVNELVDKGAGFEDLNTLMDQGLLEKSSTQPFVRDFGQNTLVKSLMAEVKPKSGLLKTIGNVAMGLVAPQLLAGTKFAKPYSLWRQYQTAKKYLPKGITDTLAKKIKASGVDTQKQATKKLVSGDTRDGEGATIQQAITGDKGLLTEGAETLGLTTDQREQYMLMQKKMKMALDQGSYTNQQGQVIQLNDQQLDQLQNYMDKLNDILQTTLQTAAHGGRIDRPLMGGSRYI